MTTSEAEAPKASGAQGIFAKSPMIFSIDSKNETLFSKCSLQNNTVVCSLLWSICFSIKGLMVYLFTCIAMVNISVWSLILSVLDERYLGVKKRAHII